MVLAKEIVGQVNFYLAGKHGERELEVWLVANLQRILNSHIPEAIDMANEIDALLVELGEGIVDRAKFRDGLVCIANVSKVYDSESVDLQLDALPSNPSSITAVFDEEEGLIIALGQEVPIAGFGTTQEAALAMLVNALRAYESVA